MSSGNKSDPCNFTSLSEEMSVSAEEFSLMSVEFGLRDADLNPLVAHLRNGFSLSPALAEMLANAIEKNPQSICHISASRSKVGNPHQSPTNLHTRNIQIGLDYLKRCEIAGNGEKKGIIYDLSKKYLIGDSAIRKAVTYTRKWLRGLSD